jgi:DNA-binding transcriptional regulator YhcF (GntR family)
MRLLLSTEAPTMEANPAETLDQLWHEAEQLGIIEVDRDWQNKAYTVQIMFVRKSGTRIMAKGADQHIHVAVSKAINEAREMGAGVPQ